MSYTLYVTEDYVASPSGKAKDIFEARKTAYRIIMRMGDIWGKKTRISIVDDQNMHGDSYEIGTVARNVKGEIIYKSWNNKKYLLTANGDLKAMKNDWHPFGL